MRYLKWLLPLCLACQAASAVQTIHLKDYLGHTWSNELISYPLDADLQKATALRVTDDTGAALPCQVVNGWLYLLVDLKADTERIFTVQPGQPAPAERQVRVNEDGGLLTFDTGVMAVRLTAGTQDFPTPAACGQVPGPLRGVRIADGAWIGKSWLGAPLKVIAYQTIVKARGPLFAEATVTYTFEGNKHYAFTLRAIAGQPTAIVDETMDLNPGGKYRLLTYKNDIERSTWDWWNFEGGDHLIKGDHSLHEANAFFSFYDGLQPDQCRWRGSQASEPRRGLDAKGKTWQAWDNYSVEAYAPLVYDRDEEFNRVSGWWVNSFPDYSMFFTILNERDPHSAAITFSQGKPSHNVNPTYDDPKQPWIKMMTEMNDLRIWTRTAKDLQVVAPIVLGSRNWLLTVEPQAALPPKGSKPISTGYLAIPKYSRYPLEKLKDWTFDWPEPKNAWPRLCCKAGDLAGMKARVAAAGEAGKSIYVPAIYQADGTPDKMVKQLWLLKSTVEDSFIAYGFGDINWFHISGNTISMMPLWDAAMATPGLDPQVRANIKAYGAFLIQRAWDDDYWPPKEGAHGWGSINMGTLASTERVMTAAVGVGIPGDAEWVKRSKGHMLGNLLPWVADDGSGVSCPSYLGASIEQVLHMSIALKYGGGYDAFKEEPRLHKFAQFMMDICTPPDPRSPIGSGSMGLPMGAKLDPNAKNRVNMWAVGDTSRTMTTSMMDELALGFSGVDEQLAGGLLTMSARMGHPAGDWSIAGAMLQNITSKPTEPDLHSRWYPGYAAFMRDNRPAESWLAYRQTQFSVDHFHVDQGAFTFWAKGMPLMLDWGSMYSPDAMWSVYHNRISWNVQEGPLKPCPGNGGPGCAYQGMMFYDHKFEPWSSECEMRADGMSATGSGGVVKCFRTLSAADYVQGETDVKLMRKEYYYPDTPQASAGNPNDSVPLVQTPPFSWLRRVLFAKAQADTDPQYVLVRDDFYGKCPPPTASFWVMAKDLKFTGNQAHATGQFGVDLELYSALPAQATYSQWSFEHQNWGGEKQLCARVTQPEGKPFLTLLYPRKPEEPLPTFTTLAHGDGVRIALPASTDYAFLAPTLVNYRDDQVAFAAPGGYLRLAGDTARIVLNTGGAATVRGITLTAQQAASLDIRKDGLQLRTDGEKQTITLSGALPAHRHLTLDGKSVSAKLKKGVLSIEVGAGAHTIVIR